jgi:hypothetical protein
MAQNPVNLKGEKYETINEVSERKLQNTVGCPDFTIYDTGL